MVPKDDIPWFPNAIPETCCEPTPSKLVPKDNDDDCELDALNVTGFVGVVLENAVKGVEALLNIFDDELLLLIPGNEDAVCAFVPEVNNAVADDDNGGGIINEDDDDVLSAAETICGLSPSMSIREFGESEP